MAPIPPVQQKLVHYRVLKPVTQSERRAGMCLLQDAGSSLASHANGFYRGLGARFSFFGSIQTLSRGVLRYIVRSVLPAVYCGSTTAARRRAPHQRAAHTQAGTSHTPAFLGLQSGAGASRRHGKASAFHEAAARKAGPWSTYHCRRRRTSAQLPWRAAAAALLLLLLLLAPLGVEPAVLEVPELAC
jgi:hypothetical protein